VGTPRGGGSPVRPPARARSSLSAGFETVGSTGVVHELTWAPTAIGAFAYSATNAQEDYDLYIGGAAVVRSPGADGGASWSPDGAFIVFTSSRSGDGDLYLIDVARIELPPRRLTAIPRASELHAAWSPDSRSIAFVGHGPTGDHLWLTTPDEAPPTQLTHLPGSQLHPSFSPEGSQLAFYASEPSSEDFGLYIMDLRPPSPPRRILASVVVDPHGPAWIDSSSLLVVAEDDDAFDPIVRVTTAGERFVLPLDTVGNRDLALNRSGSGVRLAWCAQGRRDGLVRDFRRLYTAEFSSL